MPVYRVGANSYAVQQFHAGTRSSMSGGAANTAGTGYSTDQSRIGQPERSIGQVQGPRLNLKNEDLPLSPDRQAQVSWAEFETPDPPRRCQVSWAELETPNGPRRSQVSWAEFEVPAALRRSQVSWAELEVPNGPRRALISWTELETPNGPRRSQVSWAEFEVPGGPGPASVRQAQVSWAELEVPDPYVHPSGVFALIFGGREKDRHRILRESRPERKRRKKQFKKSRQAPPPVPSISPLIHRDDLEIMDL